MMKIVGTDRTIKIYIIIILMALYKFSCLQIYLFYFTFSVYMFKLILVNSVCHFNKSL